MRPGCCLLPKRSVTGGLRSFDTPHCFSYRPDAYERLARRAPAPLSALRRWKVLQFCLASTAIHPPVGLIPVPKTTATFANLQLHAQLHDEILRMLSSSGNFALTSFAGVKGTRHGSS